MNGVVSAALVVRESGDRNMKLVPHLIAAWLLFVPPAAAQERGAPWYADRANLLFYQDDQGRPQPVKNPADWARRAAHTRANMELVMGALPAPKDVPLDPRTDKTVRLRHYTREHVTFVAEPGDRVPAWLLVPHRAAGEGRGE